MAPANGADPDAAPALTAGTHGVARGERLVWRPRWRAERAQDGVLRLAPFAHAPRDPWPAWSRRLSRRRSRSDTVFGQRVERGAITRVWARDRGHLARRLLRLVLMHTLAVHFTVQRDPPPLH